SPPAGAAPGWHPGATVAFTLDAGLHAAVDALAARTGTSLFMVVHAALATVLTRLGAGTDLPIGTLVAGRGDDALTDLVGCFANTVLLRTDTSGAPGTEELLARVRDADLAALSHADVPFEDVRRDLGLSAPQVLLVHHERAVLSGAVGGATMDALPGPRTDAELTVSVYEPQGAADVPCYLEYAADLFDRDTAERFAGDLLDTLRSMTGAELPRSALP
ncbi:MAG TPA: condensation domain-containing protein, partial [Pseudonocardiaceae bacterium]